MDTSGRATALPRQVWITSLTQEGIAGATVGEVVASSVRKMESLSSFSPDIVCLPETFHVAGLSGRQPKVAEVAETPPGPLTQPFSEFAQKHHCYVICPIYTREGDRCYNAAVLIDRQGQIMGEYRKMRPTEGEIEDGVLPGPPRHRCLRRTSGASACRSASISSGRRDGSSWGKRGQRWCSGPRLLAAARCSMPWLGCTGTAWCRAPERTAPRSAISPARNWPAPAVGRAGA
ncbi:MAG: carbon-nitrogen hydrolase family protein [Candidatus Latescibacteria bacterium]|nr:carbon-nitrogen hydrolase family protein [Candidatus Latescibacterota bacterium]